MLDVSADYLPGNEADGLVAACAVDRMAVAGAFYYSPVISDVYHPLL